MTSPKVENLKRNIKSFNKFYYLTSTESLAGA